jgi:hypothetical protein
MKNGFMVRAISLIAMTGSFLIISPNLRNTIADGYTQAGGIMVANSPYSYIALGLATLGGLMILMYKSSQPR